MNSLFENNIENFYDKIPWLKSCELKLISSIEELQSFIDNAIKLKICAVDLETTGLNTSLHAVTKTPIERIVGFCLSCEPNKGIYVPIEHVEDSDLNLIEFEVLEEIKRLVYSDCKLIFHNAKFDIAFLKNYNVKIDDPKSIEDTYLLARLYNASFNLKELGLKYLSDKLLGKKMIKFEEITGNQQFNFISPKLAYIYGSIDAICTLNLYNFFINQDIIKKQNEIYLLEKRVLFVVLEMEQNKIKIDVPYLLATEAKINDEIEKIKKNVYNYVGYEFNLSSPQQLQKVLFKEKQLYNPNEDKKLSTDDFTIQKIIKYYENRNENKIVEILKDLLRYRSLEKYLKTYVKNLLNNKDENDCVKLCFIQVGTETGRFSSPGGEGIKADGYSSVNVQSIPKEVIDDINIRRAFIPREGYKIVTADYENEEIKIAANLSNETEWIEASRKGIDFHTHTASLIFGKPHDQISKAERKKGKSVNFLSLYLGSAYALANITDMSVDEAKKILNIYFNNVKNLKRFINNTISLARKQKYVATIFNRIRPLDIFYRSNDNKLIFHGDRCAVNTIIQGTAADIMKIAMVKIYNYIHNNKLENDVHMLITMHDELVFEVKEEKLDQIVPDIMKIMQLNDILNDLLKWPLPLTVDAKYGDSWATDIVFKQKDNQTEIKKEEYKTEVEVHNKPEVKTIDNKCDESKENNELIYVINNRTKSTLRKLNDIISFLIYDEPEFFENSKKKLLKIKDKDGYVLSIDEIYVPEEPFLTLTKYFGI